MLTKLDHIDIKAADFDATVRTLLDMGLVITRRAPAPRNSVEMSLPGENQVVLEIHPAKEGGFTGIHHFPNGWERSGGTQSKGHYLQDRKYADQGYRPYRQQLQRSERTDVAADRLSRSHTEQGSTAPRKFPQDRAVLAVKIPDESRNLSQPGNVLYRKENHSRTAEISPLASLAPQPVNGLCPLCRRVFSIVQRRVFVSC